MSLTYKSNNSYEVISHFESVGYIKGASASLRGTSDEVVLVSNVCLGADAAFRVWVAMNFDTQTRFLCKVDDLIIMK